MAKRHIESLEQEIAGLQQDLKAADESKDEYDKNRAILSKLYEKGKIDQDGNLIE
jgi:prefoldin subunit 5